MTQIAYDNFGRSQMTNGGISKPVMSFEPGPEWSTWPLSATLGQPQMTVGHLRPAAIRDFYNVVQKIKIKSLTLGEIFLFVRLLYAVF